MDKRVEAIRNDMLVGHGSDTSTEMCYTDEELVEELDKLNIQTPRAAVKWAREGEEMWLEQGLNCRWGEDDDPQLLLYNEWMENLDKHPITC